MPIAPAPGGVWRAAFFYDVACPFSYLVAERVERVLGEVEWVPAPAVGLDGGARWAQFDATRALAERDALAARLPLRLARRLSGQHPSRAEGRLVRRRERRRRRFALAATRLAFCGGFDLEDPEILGDRRRGGGAGARRMPAGGARPARDRALWATARGLHARGVGALPALRLGRRFIEGERILVEGAALLGAHAL